MNENHDPVVSARMLQVIFLRTYHETVALLYEDNALSQVATFEFPEQQGDVYIYRSTLTFPHTQRTLDRVHN